LWTEPIVQLVKEHYIGVSVDARREISRQDPVGEVVRKTQCVTGTAAGQLSVITPSGKLIGHVPYTVPNEQLRIKVLQKYLAAFQAMPEEDRKPKQPLVGAPDPKRPLARPPEGTLIVATYNRRFMREPDGTLRYTEEKDYTEGEGKRECLRFREASKDFMWIPQAEWQAMIPANPHPGQEVPVPTSFTLRLFRYHLDPHRGLGEGLTYSRVATVDSGQLKLTVEDVTPSEVRLRLEGYAELVANHLLDIGKPGPTRPIRYEPAILGFITVDRAKKQITRFDMLALGDAENAPRGVLLGPYVLAVAFELVDKPTEADLVWPRGARDDLQRYLYPDSPPGASR